MLVVDEFFRPQHDDIVVAEMDGDLTCKHLSGAPAACVQLCRAAGRRSAIADGMHARGRCVGVGRRTAEHLAELDVHTAWQRLRSETPGAKALRLPWKSSE